jgi:thiamine biosynthesis lipoprotein
MRHVFETMGTVVSLDLAEAPPGILPRIERIFTDADARFSLYRDDSELSHLNRGRHPLAESSRELRDAYALAADWRLETGGAFTPTRPDGLLDLNGVVKALAMRDAGREVERAGCGDWTLVVGGDLLASGSAPDGTPWTTGIIDPADRTALLCAVELRTPRRAMATSGSAERGDHIWKAGAGRVTGADFVQATVVADDIVTADVWATAAVAAGVEAPALLQRSGLDHVLVTDDGARYASLTGRRVTSG